MSFDRARFVVAPLVLGILLTIARADDSGKAPVAWSLDVRDVRGDVVNAERLRWHATLLIVSTRQSRDRAMRLGQDAGARFGRRPGFLSVSVANTSRLSFLLRPLAASGVAEAEQEAVDEAVARQRAAGHPDVTAQDVRTRLLFIHDTDGRVSRTLGIPADDDALYAGLVDPAARVVHLTREPIDEAALFGALEAQLAKVAARE